MKRFISLILCLSVLLTFTACGDEHTAHVPTGDGLTWDDDPLTPEATEPSAEQELVLAYYPDESLNPLLCTDFTNRTLFSLIYQGLFTVDSKYNVEPMLCKSYRMSDSMKTYTFYLEDATFSDGTPVTTQDVLATYLAAQESDYYGGRFQQIKEIFLSADGGITFDLKTAHENLPIMLDIPILKEAEVAADRPLGTGPYHLDETMAGLHLRRRINWWCEAEMVINTTSIPLVASKSPAQIRDEFEFRDVGLVCAYPGTDNYADYRSDYELWDCDTGIFLYIGCNASNSDLFVNDNIRSALTYAIDREYLVNTFYRGFAHSATLPASPASPYYSNQLASRYDYEPGIFEQVLADEGVVGWPVRVLVNKDDSLRVRVARAIGDILTECGLKVQMLEMNRSDYLYALGTRNFDIYVGQTKLSPNMDLSQFFKEYGTFRYGGMTDSALYSLCLDALANQGNYYNLHQNIAEDGRLIPLLFHSYAVYATRGLLTDLTPARDNVFYYSLGKTMRDALMYNE